VIGSRDSGSRITTSQHRIVLRAAPDRGPKRRRATRFPLGGPSATVTWFTSSAWRAPMAAEIEPLAFEQSCIPTNVTLG
jgi:hypothetical protein